MLFLEKLLKTKLHLILIFNKLPLLLFNFLYLKQKHVTVVLQEEGYLTFILDVRDVVLVEHVHQDLQQRSTMIMQRGQKKWLWQQKNITYT